jgi:hypothetical protein
MRITPNFVFVIELHSHANWAKVLATFPSLLYQMVMLLSHGAIQRLAIKTKRNPGRRQEQVFKF